MTFRTNSKNKYNMVLFIVKGEIMGFFKDISNKVSDKLNNNNEWIKLRKNLRIPLFNQPELQKDSEVICL